MKLNSLTEFEILDPSPVGWWVFGFVSPEKKPNICSGESCLCICKIDQTVGGTYSFGGTMPAFGVQGIDVSTYVFVPYVPQEKFDRFTTTTIGGSGPGGLVPEGDFEV